MNNFMHKNWPVLFAAAFVILAFALSIRVTTVNQPGKGLMFKLVSKAPLLVEENVVETVELSKEGKKLRLTLDGEPLKAPHMTTYLIKNTGVAPIEREEFETPIQVLMQNNARILKVRHEFIPKDINSDITFEKNRVQLTPALFNPGDMIILQILTDGERPDMHAGARIKGVERIVTTETDADWAEVGWLELLFFFLTLFVFLLFTLIMKEDVENYFVFIHRKLAIIILLTLGVVSLQDYFDMLANHPETMLTSKLLFTALMLLALLLAWVCKERFSGKDE